jgi:hypothetical protein
VQLIITASSAILPVPRGSADAALFAEALTASVQEAAAARTRMEDFGEDALSLDSGEACGLWVVVLGHRVVTLTLGLMK